MQVCLQRQWPNNGVYFAKIEIILHKFLHIAKKKYKKIDKKYCLFIAKYPPIIRINRIEQKEFYTSHS